MTTTITATTEHAPRIWVGCMNCYNNARIVGAWYDATDIADDPETCTVETIHADGGYPATPECEELWGYDHENIPVRGELSPSTAAKWGEKYAELDDDALWPALLAWADNHHDTDPDVEDFKDKYQGNWGSLQDYVRSFESETDFMQDWPELAIAHFDWESYTNDISGDYDELDAPSGYWIMRCH